ncbi:MAG: hypothetical protein MJZ38_00055 [archaeon]|nr:hypothetical protein [archaeon]
MDSSDPYRSTNPWSLARYLKNNCTSCPQCRKACQFDVTVDREAELIIMHSACPDCGRIRLVPFLEEDMDLTILNGASVYEPDQDVFDALTQAGDFETEGASAEKLSLLGRIASRYAETRRVGAAVRLGTAVADGFRNVAGDEALSLVTSLATMLNNSDRSKEALELFDRYRDLAEGRETGKAYAFQLARAFCVFTNGDAKEPTATVRAIITALDRMRTEGTLPEGDPFIRSRAYEALGMLLSAKNDRAGSMKAMRKAFEDAQDVLKTQMSEEGLKWMNRCAREYAFSCFHADMKKRSMEALKDAVKTCSLHRDEYPFAYAEALLERGMFISDSNSDLPPYLRGDMDEAIGILSRPDDSGRYDPLLPVAYYYRSMTGPDREKLDSADLEKAYEIIRDGVKSGDVPETVLTAVMDTYATYLDVYEEEKAVTVRRELAEMGIWIRPPLKKPKKSE